MIEVRVPATSANMGAGFDTLGIALCLYNVIRVWETEKDLQIVTHHPGGYVSSGEDNLIYKAMHRLFQAAGYRPGGLRIEQKSQIPMTRGLGSSSACIIGGMLAANVLAGRPFTYREILNFAAEMEGHPDNVAPALFGGFCVSAMENGVTACQSFKLEQRLKFAVMIPDFFVATKKSRGALPETVPFRDAVFNISHAAALVAALAAGNIDAIAVGVRDRLHQQYRKNYIDGMDKIFDQSYVLGAKGTYLSGSGPTILSILREQDAVWFSAEMNRFLGGFSEPWKCRILSIDNVGAVLKVSGQNK